MIQAGAIASVSYLFPKLTSYLCTKPERDAANNRLNQMRAVLARVQQQMEKLVGERVWDSFTEVVLDNAWISALFLSYIVEFSKLRTNPRMRIEAAFLVLYISVASWTIRRKISSADMIPKKLTT